MKLRIKFYPPNDLASFYFIEQSINIIINFDNTKTYTDINDIIELYNIIKYINDNRFPKEKIDTNLLLSFKKTSNIIITNFFLDYLNDINFIEYYSTLEPNYHDDFWEILEQRDYIKKFNKETIKNLIVSNDKLLFEIVHRKKIVNIFDKSITEKMLSCPSLSMPILLQKYEYNKPNIFIPKSLSQSMKQSIINEYINITPELSSLYLIVNFQSNQDTLDITPKIKLKAKTKIERLEKEFFKSNKNVLKFTTTIKIKKQSELIQQQIANDEITICYSKEWLEKNLKPLTILNNFIYLFDFIDLQDRCTLITKIKEISILELTMNNYSPHSYIDNSLFYFKDEQSLLTLNLYYNFLLQHKIRLEDIIEYFFNTYIEETFHIKGFNIKMPSPTSTLLEKCSSIMPAIEYVLKEFKSFVQYKEIDHELLSLTSEPLLYANISSLLEKKYIYVNSPIMKNILHYLYSNQTTLNHKKNTNKFYKNLFEFLNKKTVFYFDFEDYDIPIINDLFNYNILSLNKSTQQIIFEPIKLYLLKDLYYNEYISYWYLSTKEKSIIDEFINNDFLYSKSTLLSTPESDYFNFFLNKAKFNNGLDLRNKYAHTQPFSNDENIHYTNYLRFLRLAIIITLKIHDELIIFYDYYKQGENHS